MNSMKKYMMAVALMVLSVMTAVAQDVENPVGKISVIPRIGVVLSNWSNNKIYFTTEENADYMKSKYQAGFMGGVDFEYRATEQVGISLGAYYAKQGFRWPSYQTESKDNGKTVLTGYNNQHVDLNYVQVPLMVRPTSHASWLFWWVYRLASSVVMLNIRGILRKLRLIIPAIRCMRRKNPLMRNGQLRNVMSLFRLAWLTSIRM